MRSMSAPVLAALASGTATLVQFVKIDFPSGTIALNSSNWSFDYAGTTYLGAADLGSVSPIDDRPGDLPGIQLELINVDSAHLAIALDDTDEVQGSLVTISTAILDADLQILDVEVDWVGYADKMTIAEDGEKGSITLSAESKAVDLLRGQSLTYTDADQKTQYTFDRAFEYVADQADKPVVWPSREWFFK